MPKREKFNETFRARRRTRLTAFLYEDRAPEIMKGEGLRVPIACPRYTRMAGKTEGRKAPRKNKSRSF